MDIYEFIAEMFGSQKATNIVEVGAHIGSDSVKLYKFVGEGWMKIFEPDPRNISLLRQKTSLMGSNVEVIEKAIGPTVGKAQFHLSSGTPPYEDVLITETKQHTASSSLKPPKTHLERFPWVQFQECVEVDMITLDESCPGDDVIDLLWADVQGAEEGLILGGQKTLARTKFLFTEFSNDEMYEGQAGIDVLVGKLPGKWSIVALLGDEILLQNNAFGEDRGRLDIMDWRVWKLQPLSIVIQGAISPFTQRSIESIRTHFPQAKIILSTWKGEILDGLSPDEVLLLDDPGPGPCGNNIVRQVTGSLAGIRAASSMAVMRIRSDAIFLGAGCMDHLGRWTKKSSEFGILKDRLIVPNIGTCDPETHHVGFQVTDWAILGRQDDLEYLYDIPLEAAGDTKKSLEQYIWLSAIQKSMPEIDVPCLTYMDDDIKEKTKLFMRNNVVILDTRRQYNMFCGKWEHVPDDEVVTMKFAKWKAWYDEI